MHVTDIQFLVFDVDGVLTDGSIVLNDLGHETKHFHVRDGFAIKAAADAGLKVGVITGRSSKVVALRMAELGIDFFVQGVKEKAEALELLCARVGLHPSAAAYMGDDLIDLPAMRRCGYAMAVADAAPEVRKIARFVSTLTGGRGAVREAVEHVLKAQGKWGAIVEKYGG